MPRPRRAVQLSAVGAALFFAAVLPASAGAQTPTITATGQGEVKPEPANRKIDASIRKSVQVAHAAALPLAIADARAKATEIATAAGLTLGPLVSIADAPQPGYPFFSPSRTARSGTASTAARSATSRRSCSPTGPGAASSPRAHTRSAACRPRSMPTSR